MCNATQEMDESISFRAELSLHQINLTELVFVVCNIGDVELNDTVYSKANTLVMVAVSSNIGYFLVFWYLSWSCSLFNLRKSNQHCL